MKDLKQVFAIIAKAPLEGFSKTRLERALGSANAQLLYQAFLEDFFYSLSKNISFFSDLNLIHIHSTPEDEKTKKLFEGYLSQCACDGKLTFQSGVPFFERLKEIFQANQGFIHLTGTDIPDFPFHFLENVTDFSKVYIGPDRDGGYYYLGADSKHHELFNIEPSKDVLAQTLAKAKKLGLETILLPEWSDVDDEEDLVHTLRRSAKEVIPQTHLAAKELNLLK